MYEACAIPAYILAGGRSTRFGADKARAEVEGVSLMARQARVLAGLGMAVTAVADVADKYADLGVRTVADRVPGLGPMGGLVTALADAGSGTEWVLVTSCDLLRLEGDWVRVLRGACADAAEIVAFRDERWQPLPALYRVGLRTRVEGLIAGGQLALWALFESSRVVAAPRPVDWPERLAANSTAELAAFASGRRTQKRKGIADGS